MSTWKSYTKESIEWIWESNNRNYLFQLLYSKAKGLFKRLDGFEFVFIRAQNEIWRNNIVQDHKLQVKLAEKNIRCSILAQSTTS